MRYCHPHNHHHQWSPVSPPMAPSGNVVLNHHDFHQYHEDFKLMQILIMKNVKYLGTLETNTGSLHNFFCWSGSKNPCLFQTFFIFRQSLPSLRDLQSRLQIELFESSRLADFYCWHIWMLHLHLVELSLTVVNLCRNQGSDFYCPNLVWPVISCRLVIHVGFKFLFFNNLIVIKIVITACAPLSSNHRLSRVLAIKSVLATDGTETLFSRSLFQKINIAGHTIKAISLH